MSDLTVVTGIWDLGRDRAGPGFERSFEHYKSKFAELAAADVPMVIFGDESLRAFVGEVRGKRPTDFRARPTSHFAEHFDFHDRVQEIRRDPAWLGQAGWLPDSPQASLALYNPMVMSKMFMLHDASIWNPFGTKHWAWIDGAITNTVHPGYFTHDRVFARVEPLLEKFLFVTFPYHGGNEIHGFDRRGMRAFCGVDPQYVCRGGFFGGHIDCLSDVNAHYYELLGASLHEGYMGTEESVFTIMAHEEPALYDRHALQPEHSGLLQHFFEHVKGLPDQSRMADRARRSDTRRRGAAAPETSGKSVAGYVVTFNAPDQLSAVLESWTTQFAFDQLYILDNSTDDHARCENARIARHYGAAELKHPKGNCGVCGARQYVAEHFDTTDHHYCVYIEDDMFLNGAAQDGVCRNGMRLSAPNVRDLLLKIMIREDYDFIKLSFTEFFGDNKTQFSWYNVPQPVRQRWWPEKPDAPVGGLDPDAPSTLFGTIGTVDGVSYIDGEVYYCNWPHIVSKAGNKRMFLDTVFANPYEQTWMSHMYQLTVQGKLRPAVLLASLVTHNRFHHYEADARREN
ncbi:MAG TPA: WlaTC/HtrL family glycosyltransferase [Gemmatimonadaceae bacterium]|nr:WlaTC/HtrL family glycosyltransferase [Gemmatimonadaceae bacterium]